VSRSFADVLAAVEEVPGWLSGDQARRLYERAAAVPRGGTIVELGSFRGRSTIVLAAGAPAGVSVFAVDPYAGNDRGPREWTGRVAEAERDLTAFRRNVDRAGVSQAVVQVRATSSDALAEVAAPVDLLYVDAAHRYGPCRSDLVQWGARVVPGGAMLVHDAFASVGVTLAILRSLALDSHFVFVGRTRSLAEYRRAGEKLQWPARLLSGLRQLAQLPWFVRNLAIKAALVAGFRSLAGRLGHHASDEWPY
jgi:predicted O-methyltransferase YrrM